MPENRAPSRAHPSDQNPVPPKPAPSTEEILARERQRAAQVERLARMGSWEYDPQSDQMTWSEGMYAVFGLEPGGRTPSFDRCRHVFVEEDQSIVDDIRRIGIEAREPFDLRGQFVRPDGTTGWIRCHGEYDEHAPGGPRVLGTVQDITREREAADEVLRSEGLLSEAQEVAHVGSWAWDVAPDVITWSDELYRLYGLEPGSPAPDFQRYLSMIHPDDRAMAGAVVQQAMETHEPYVFEHRVVRANDGAVRWLQGRGRVLTGTDGQVLRMVGTALDITERVEAAQAVGRTRSRLMETEKLAALGTLVMGVAHEVRTPMTFVTNNMHVVLGIVRRCLGTLRNDERMRAAEAAAGGAPAARLREPDGVAKSLTAVVEGLTLIQERAEASLAGVRQIGRVLDDVRATYRADLAHEPSEAHDVRELCEHALRLVEPALGSNIRLDAQLADTPPIELVRGQIIQVVVNLVTNAAEAMRGRGLITVRTRSDADSVFIEVLDEGPGLKDADVSELFEPFHTTKESGTGLGLFLTKEIAERHGSFIEALDREDREGALFRLRIPRSHSAGPEPAEAPQEVA